MVISLCGWKCGLEERGEKEIDAEDGIQMSKQGSGCYWGTLGYALQFYGAHRYIAGATGDPIHSGALMVKPATVYSLNIVLQAKRGHSW